LFAIYQHYLYMGYNTMISLKKLEFSELEVADPNAVYSGTQTVFLDFDGANDISYDNATLDIHTSISSIADSGLSAEDKIQIMTDLNNTFAGTGITFTVIVPISGEYSTVYVGGDGSEFSEYGSFAGLSETIDVGNEIQNDDAFVFSDNLSSVDAITETIAHETAHLVGYTHVGDTTIDELSDFATVITLPRGTTKFTSTTGMAYDGFGYSVAVSGSNVIVGAYADDNANGEEAGSVYSYRWNGTSYDAQVEIIASDGLDDWFGFSVDGYGDTIISGAGWGDGVVADSGAAYVYSWNVDSYTESKLVAADGAVYDYFGDAVAMSGNAVVVGAHGDDNAKGIDAGSAYVYHWDGDSYEYQDKLIALDGAANAGFGYTVAVSGYNIAVGAFSYSGASADSVYVYRWDGASYDEMKLTNTLGASALFASSIAMDGDVVAVGAHCDNTSNGIYSGCVVVYRWNGETYDMSYLIASDGAKRDFFGKSVAVSGNHIVVGAYGDDDSGAASGSIYAYNWNGTSYDEYKITAEDGSALDFYGGAVDIDGGYIAVGAYADDDVGYNAGSAYSINFTEIIEYSAGPNTPSGDFDGNNKSDILWQYTDGNVYVWDDGDSANGLDLLGNSSSSYAFLDTGDFNGDDKSDILWQHTDGSVSAWNDGNSGDIDSLGSAPSDYAFLGTGDFDDNDKSDILWRNTSNGNVYTWDDGLLANSRSNGVASSDYTFLGVGDFDYNGKSDILWQHSDGNVYAWNDGAGSDFGTSLGDAPLDYAYLGIGDFDGNRTSDILWQDSYGFVHAWDDGEFANDRVLGEASVNYAFIGIGDFDGNRISDILWRDSAGNVYAWNDGELGSGWDNLIGSASTTDYTALSNIA